MSDDTIKCCPRCGSENIIYGWDSETIFMACRDCEKKGPRRAWTWEACAAWNNKLWRFLLGWR